MTRNGLDEGLAGPDHFDAELSALLDGELSPAEVREVEQHLDVCADCRSERDSLEQVRRSMRDLPRLEAPPGLVEGIVAGRQRATRRAVAVLGAAASLLVTLSFAAAEPGDQPGTGATSAPTEARGDNGLVRLESGRRSDGDGEAERSLSDRAHDAAQELLEFLAG